MVVKSLKIKNVSYYFWNDIIYLNKFDNSMLKINKRENRENNNTYYISYIINKPEYDINIVNNLYIAIQNLYCTIDKIDGSRDRYLVIDKNNRMNKKNIFDDNIIKITDWNKFKFSSDLDMSIDTLINFNSLTIIFSHVVEKGNKFIPEFMWTHEYLKKYNIKMVQLKIKDKLFLHPSRLNNKLDINLDKISVENILSLNDLGIYYIKYDENVFYLVIDDIKGYFETNGDGVNYLTIIFYNEKYEKIFKSIWYKI